MDEWVAVAGFVVLGVLLAGIALATVAPTADRTLVVHDEGERDAASTDVRYDELPPVAQAAVDDAIDSSGATLQTYADYEAVEALRNVRTVGMPDRTVSIRVESADGSTPFEGMLHDSILAFGGLLVGAGAVYNWRHRTPAALLALPIGAFLAVVGLNAVRTPDPSLVSWIGLAAFALAAALPALVVFAGVRPGRISVSLAVLTVVAALVVLSLGDGLSALFVLAPPVIIGLPGGVLGVVLARTGAPRRSQRPDPGTG